MVGYTMEPVYYGLLGTNKNVQIFQVILYDKLQFGTSTKCLNYAGVLIFKCPQGFIEYLKVDCKSAVFTHFH